MQGNPNENRHWPFWLVPLETVETKHLVHDAEDAVRKLMDVLTELKRRVDEKQPT